MVERRGEESQVSVLLRVGLGAVWVCEGLVGKLLGPASDLVAVLTRTLSLSGDPAALIQALGAFEVLLGLLLLLGRMVRSVAGVQCGLLVAFSLLTSANTAHASVFPAGALSKNAALCAAGLCLVLAGGGRGASPKSSRRLWAVPVILRLGLGLVWLTHGILLAGGFSEPTAAEFVARAGLVAGQRSAFLTWLGVLEASLGLMILSGVCVRGLAVLQVGLLTAYTVVVGRTPPAFPSDALGDLWKNLGLIGEALVLYRVGGGAFSLDAWLWRTPAWQRLALLATLQRSLAAKVGTAEVYRVQSQAPADPEADGLLQKLRLDEESGGVDVASLIHRQGGRPLPVTGLARGLAWVLGCLTVILGMRASLGVDVWLEEHGLRLFERAGRLLPPEDGITARALQAMRDREARHVRLLRDHLRARRVRPPSPR